MAEYTPVQVLTRYFNDGEGKRPIAVWRAELQAFSAEERNALALDVCAVTGDTLRQ